MVFPGSEAVACGGFSPDGKDESVAALQAASARKQARSKYRISNLRYRIVPCVSQARNANLLNSQFVCMLKQ
jgi:hypothetical protein